VDNKQPKRRTTSRSKITNISKTVKKWIENLEYLKPTPEKPLSKEVILLVFLTLNEIIKLRIYNIIETKKPNIRIITNTNW